MKEIIRTVRKTGEPGIKAQGALLHRVDFDIELGLPHNNDATASTSVSGIKDVHPIA